MEKQMERRREPEPVIYERIAEELWLGQQKEKQRIASLPRVRKGSETPFRQNAQAYRKAYGDTGMKNRLVNAPLVTMTVSEQIIPPSNKSGRHRHYNEAIFYVLDGDGYEIHDDIKYPWQAGDIMSVPSYCVHQHFNPSDKPVRFFFSTGTNIVEFMGVGIKEQFEMHPSYQIPEGGHPLYDPQGDLLGYKAADGMEFRFGVNKEFQQLMKNKMDAQFSGKPQNIYDEFLKLLADQNAWRRAAPHVIKQETCSWQDTRMGRIKYLVSPFQPSGLRLYDAFLQELPPGGRSGKHRHVSEEVHRILEGKGYDIHDGVKWDWEEEDVVFMPVNTVHQHFNADPKRPARFISFQSRLYYYLGHGGIEHLEDAQG
ncbi:MAG: cupin domain-containing protein [Dehalococcoidia bacterium]|nr:cupin domain-containing protein [Dehalococcoidia bacterium]